MTFKNFTISKLCLIIKIKLLEKHILYYHFILHALFQSAQHPQEKGRIRIRYLSNEYVYVMPKKLRILRNRKLYTTREWKILHKKPCFFKYENIFVECLPSVMSFTPWGVRINNQKGKHGHCLYIEYNAKQQQNNTTYLVITVFRKK
jgi:hypothetical protein